MNKQQLASKIWESANKMRSKIEANEYKDYILGFIFYKFLSNKEVKEMEAMGASDEEELKQILQESNTRIVDQLKNRIGYFIAYDNLFSTWIKKGKDFDVSNVRDGLSAFDRLINPNHKKVFEGIFNTLQTGLSKLGDNSKSQTKAISDLLYLIKDIPMDGKQDYDVLGFIYEYLISNFAANAGKKAGEFYTPHEVSLLMSEIIAEHLKDRDKIEIYDPTSGSGSLLINIGKSASKYIKGENRIKYFAQELKQNTYNLTRMNLVMRGILPENIVTRNGDTLAEDWPFFDEKHEYTPLYVDEVVSNPPYSQNWDPTDMEVDARFKDYGLAPKSKADYAFLLHDLYHLKDDGIMAIVLPHGVLFRGGEEGEIRKNLIEKNNIDCIIGLPANIFFGTGIPTIIMILKKNKTNTDIQIIDASKGFIKEGKNNKLRACDIKKIVDTVIKRKDIAKYSRVVSRDEIRNNDYNLNIPRYVDSSDEQESYDIYSLMFGGIPEIELESLDKYWKAFPSLKADLFNKINNDYNELKSEKVDEIVNNNNEVIKFKENYKEILKNYNGHLNKYLLDDINNIDINRGEEDLSRELFDMLDSNNLIDNYEAFQILDDSWNKIAQDLEIIQTEGLDSVRKVDPKMVLKKKNGKEEEIQEGWVGRIIPLELIQEYKLKDELDSINDKNNKLSDISSQYEELFENVQEDDKDSISNDDNTAFDFKKVAIRAKEIVKEKIEVEKDSIEEILLKVNKLQETEKNLKKEVKNGTEKLIDDSKKSIENLTDSEINELLKIKWIDTLSDKLNDLSNEVISNLVKKIEAISSKYSETLIDIDKQIKKEEKELSSMIDELTGSEYDMKGLEEFKSLLGGI